jgi:UDPglucose 6-dehydrogenase
MRKDIIRSFFTFFLIISISIYSHASEPRTITKQNKAGTSHTITVIGSGYVGLVTGACLAEFGNNIICADVDITKIKKLKGGHLPIYEPGLEKIVSKNVNSGHLSFTTDVAQAIEDADVIFIAVGTPMGEKGTADLSALENVIETIAHTIHSFKVIVTKSTVPIGTGKWLKDTLTHTYGIDENLFAIVSNPEFLREGSAVNDFLYPDRLVIGTESDKAFKIITEVYDHLISNNTPYVFTNVVTAESIKYASNAFLAVKITYINEIANLCDATGADVGTVSYALGLDSRISNKFLRPGPGFGGSCFPKDTKALVLTAKELGLSLETVQAALTANERQKRQPFKKLFKLTNQKIADKTIAVLGLAFKADTDDIRYSPAIKTIEKLLKYSAHVKAYDPEAMNNMAQIFPTITYCPSIEDAVCDADAIIIMTEWNEFKQMDLEHISTLVKQRIIVDTRNILDPAKLNELGFAFDNIGRSYLYATGKSKSTYYPQNRSIKL